MPETHSTQSSLDILKQVIQAQQSPDALQEVSEPQKLLIQDFVPMSESVEWQLSNWHWQNDGVASFIEGEVPYIINNSGRLSLQTAKLLYAQLDSIEQSDENVILMELGAGTGLFARYLLDHLKRLCEKHGTDYYQKITYYVTDYAQTSLNDWQRLGVFDEHSEQVTLATCDANKPLDLTLLTGEQVCLQRLNFVFCNYMLGVLPATMLKQINGQWHEILISTHITPGNLASNQKCHFSELQESLNSGKSADTESLLKLSEKLDFETKYVPLRESLRSYVESLPEGTEDDDRFLLNYGAIESMETMLTALHPKGGILVNDYGPTLPEHNQEYAAFSKFGATTATGLNFLHLKPYFDFAGYIFAVPEDTEKASVQNRLLAHPDSSELAAPFQQYFGEESELDYQQPIEDARHHLLTDNRTEVLACYQQALSLNPHDWSILTEVADYLIMQIEDFDAGVTLAQDAAQINPWYSAWVWNVLGDGYYCQNELDKAHEAYTRAQNIAPQDPRTNLNLAYSYLQKERYQDALNAISVGLANDHDSEFRIKLLEKQQQVLTAISDQYQARKQALDSRNSRLCE